MNFRRVQQLIEAGEGFEVEFKRKVSSPEKIAKTQIAFANTSGGHILFGVDDDGSVVGVESEKSEVNLIREAAQVYCLPEIEPQIDIVAFDDKDVIVAYIAESEAKPHYFVGGADDENGNDSKVFIRVNDKTMAASKEVVRILRNESPDAPPFRIEIGENEQRLFRYLEANDRITKKEFSKLVNISDHRASRILVSLVRAGVVRIHTLEKTDFFTLTRNISP